jgi:hypothetical protein
VLELGTHGNRILMLPRLVEPESLAATKTKLANMFAVLTGYRMPTLWSHPFSAFRFQRSLMMWQLLTRKGKLQHSNAM